MPGHQLMGANSKKGPELHVANSLELWGPS